MAEINVTPLVDGAGSAHYLHGDRAAAGRRSADRPAGKPGRGARPAGRAGTSHDDRDGTITIDDAPVAEAALANKLAEIAAQPQPEEGRRIYLRADRTLDYGRVMRVMGELNRAGLNRVALVSVGPEDQ